VPIESVSLTRDTGLLYEALFYVWNSAEDPGHILVGPCGNFALPITRDLAVALPYLRDTRYVHSEPYAS